MMQYVSIHFDSNCPKPGKNNLCLTITANREKHLYNIKHGDNPEAIKEIDFYDFIDNEDDLIYKWRNEVHTYLRGQDAR